MTQMTLREHVKTKKKKDSISKICLHFLTLYEFIDICTFRSQLDLDIFDGPQETIDASWALEKARRLLSKWKVSYPHKQHQTRYMAITTTKQTMLSLSIQNRTNATIVILVTMMLVQIELNNTQYATSIISRNDRNRKIIINNSNNL